MPNIYLYFIIALSVIIIIMLIILLTKKPKSDNSAALLNQKMDINAKATDEKIEKLSAQMHTLTNKNYEQQIKLIETLNENADKQTKMVGDAITAMQKSNEEKLEQMRRTVDEKLTETLGKRLDTSFKTVSEQLSNVYKSLGEMKELSAGVTTSVTGLNRVLTNVKSRGTWAEVQLGNILDQTIPHNMYETNVQTNPKYNGRVEFAVKIPNQESGEFTYLPIDSKFPMEDYARLSAASDIADAEAVEKAKKALETRIKDEAKLIKQYISEPETTPFAIMYLATEGLYAEITASRTGLYEKLQADGIMIAGPSTITALLNSLAMGFRTMAINEKANEVWKVLGAAKAQYDKFAVLLEKQEKKLMRQEKSLTRLTTETALSRKISEKLKHSTAEHQTIFSA